MRYLIACIICFLFSPELFAQENLSIEQALDAGLKNNYAISIEKNNSRIAENSNSLGNAGMLPKVDLNASVSFANNATKQEFSSGLVVDKAGVNSNNITSGVYLTWTLFDGMKMFATKERLSEVEAMGLLAVKLQIEQTVSDIIVSYYSIVRQKQLVKGLSENISISTERLKIAKARSDIGSGSGLEVMQAQIDLNAQTSVMYRQKTILSQYKVELNRILARPSETEFEVQDSIPVDFLLKYEELKNSIQSSNASFVTAQRSVALSQHVLKETRSQLYPRLNFNANYLFTRSQNQAGFALLNQNLGLNLGLTASWTIFNGMNANNQIKNARLLVENANTELTSTKLLLESQLLSAMKNYQDDQKILQLEEENQKIVIKAVQIALERFRIGSSNALELKEIQKSYEDALFRLAEARYNAKVTETTLMKLAGTLVK